MRLTGHPDLLDHLAAQYALGVLRGGARRRLEQLAREEAAVRTAIGHWQARLAGLAELQPAAEPVEAVWCGIEQRLGWKPAPGAKPAQPWWQRLWEAPTFWRVSTAALAMVTVLAIGVSRILVNQLELTPQVSAVAILNDAQAQPAALVTWDARAGMVTVRRLDHLELTDKQVLQLWALPEGGKPQSLGVIGQRHEVRMAVKAAPGSVPALAISIEPPGGSPNPDGPSGPVVFQGRLVNQPV
ncbi:Anti-sigma-K factor RskA [Cupriavidus sp. YR651]|uniref:anti-sigma factor n=1 Tax=Cupriavidus sp. YR651 TaxID=1855315 RepID=UPI000886E9ED|nr:anti-sigma factor [Cupriavidus sp. YR651]SDC22855.1 Anti-sigma-K factor RskA [Cupriavidus sp. YR651]